jgi:DNA-binding LacI/PurR family transcriptional regulator
MGERGVRHTKFGRNVTIRDVASAAGVSHQTVANVLNAPERVAQSTKALVEQHIAELGFRPNRLAQTLSARRSRLIGFRVPARSGLATGGILDSFMQALAEAAEAIDHHIVLFHSEPGQAEVVKARQIYHDSVADAFVVAETSDGDPRIAAYNEAQLKFVTFGRSGSPADHHWVDTDNVLGARLATRHLLELGHESIGFLGWPGASLVGDDRMTGWREEMQAAGLHHADDVVALAVNERAAGVAAVGVLLDSRPDLTAVVAVSDVLALDVLDAAAERGRDISVVGYDDGPLATVGSGLTTVRQPIVEIAQRILAITAELIAGFHPAPIHERVTPHLVVRGSTRRRVAGNLPVARTSPTTTDQNQGAPQ